MTETTINKDSHIAQIEKALEHSYTKSVSERLKTTAEVLAAVQSKDTAAELLLSHIRKPVWEDTAEGDALHQVATYKFMMAEMFEAVRHFTADGEKGQYKEINNYYRKKESGNTDVKIRTMAFQTSGQLDRMISSFSGLPRPIRLYRGLNSERVAASTIETMHYHDAGFTSASSDIETAITYAQNVKTILVIDLPKGFKAVSVWKASRKPNEKEVLLPRGIDLKVTDFDSKMGFNLLYARP